MAQGIEDGYLAACEILRGPGQPGRHRHHASTTILARKPSRRQHRRSRSRRRRVAGAITTRPSFEDQHPAAGPGPGHVRRTCSTTCCDTGGPEQKTIIFCARDRHADDVAIAMNNLYADWCAEQGKTAPGALRLQMHRRVGGADYLADLRGASRSHFIATTVDLLTTGVDVPCVRNIVFFKYVRSPIAFYQMVGRGTRIDAPTGKLMFRVYDYTDATRLFGEDFVLQCRPRKAGEARATAAARAHHPWSRASRCTSPTPGATS